VEADGPTRVEYLRTGAYLCRTHEDGPETQQKREVLMRITCATSIIAAAAVAALLSVPTVSLAQSAPAPQMKKIGTAATTAPEKPKVEPALIVMNSRGATLQGQTLTLTGVSSNSIIFADRPVRAAGHALTAHLIEEWASGDDSFGKDPPNATVSVFSKDASSVKDAVVVLKSPKLEGDKLTFNVQVLEGDLNGGDGPASVFIDIIGLPFTPLSFAGVARRTAYRGAYYAGAAAAVGAAAYAAAPYAAPYVAPYPYARPACGIYPYPPCY
jgi:hypothetical protein